MAAGDLAPLDLVLVNAGADPYGADVGVVMTDDQVLHLSREVGHPAVWSLADFAARPRYGHLLGGKRSTRARPPRTGPPSGAAPG